MLGHISRDLAPKYAELIRRGKIAHAKISKVINSGEKIEVSITYEIDDAALDNKHHSKLWKSICTIQNVSGVYSIKCLASGRQYLGSSTDVKSRTQQHFGQLCSGVHPNGALQSDFGHYGWDAFQAIIIQPNLSKSALLAAESAAISSLLSRNALLYNMTQDGQGVGFKPLGSATSETISDRCSGKSVGLARSETTPEESSREASLNNQIQQVRAVIIKEIDDTQSATRTEKDKRFNTALKITYTSLGVILFLANLDKGMVFSLLIGLIGPLAFMVIPIIPIGLGYFMDDAIYDKRLTSIENGIFKKYRITSLDSITGYELSNHPRESRLEKTTLASPVGISAKSVQNSNFSAPIDPQPIVADLKSWGWQVVDDGRKWSLYKGRRCEYAYTREDLKKFWLEHNSEAYIAVRSLNPVQRSEPPPAEAIRRVGRSSTEQITRLEKSHSAQTALPDVQPIVTELESWGWNVSHDGMKWSLVRGSRKLILYTREDLRHFWINHKAEEIALARPLHAAINSESPELTASDYEWNHQLAERIPDNHSVILTVRQWEDGPWLARAFSAREAAVAFLKTVPQLEQYKTEGGFIAAVEANSEVAADALYDAGIKPLDSETGVNKATVMVNLLGRMGAVPSSPEPTSPLKMKALKKPDTKEDSKRIPTTPRPENSLGIERFNTGQ